MSRKNQRPAKPIRQTTIVGLVMSLAIMGALTGCGDDPASETTKPKTSSVTPATAATAATAETPADDGPDVEAAEDAVRDDLPDIPLWEGTKFTGTVVSDSEVCVDRKIKKENEIGNTGTTSHVPVSWPDLEIGEPQDGPCSKADETADKEIVAARRFYMRMDNLAIKLDKAINDAQDGKPGATAKLKSLKRRIHRLNTDYLLDGPGDASVGGNLLASASSTAVNAAEDDDIAELARQRREIADARNELADEALN